MRVAVGLSGGVDSAVTAALLKEQGHDVIGVFMKNWSDDFGIQGDCPWEQDQEDAKAVADHLGIEFLSYNFERQYRERVIEYFFSEYKAGRTPNPDILCNSEIKFNLFLKKCLQELGADKIATGHYARVVESTQYSVHSTQLEKLPAATYHLLKGIDTNKDQSYFLCQLTQAELATSLFPVGHLTKPQVREYAAKLNLPVATKKDSQGICFVGKINVREFIRSELGSQNGKMIDIDSGKTLGEHQGLWFYTIGQREGLGLGGGPWFVVKKDLGTNTLWIAKSGDNPALFQKEIFLENMNFINPDFMQKLELGAPIPVEVSLRYRQKPQKAWISIQYSVTSTQSKVLNPGKQNSNNVKISFDSPQRAVAPGQFGCIFLGDEIVASGVIK